LYTGCYISDDYTYIEIEGKEGLISDGSRKLEDLINSKQYQEVFKKLSDFRNSIVSIWLKNQSKILQFNLE
jgi:hypothetical protein